MKFTSIINHGQQFGWVQLPPTVSGNAEIKIIGGANMARPNKKATNATPKTTTLDFISTDMIADVKKTYENDNTILFSLTLRPAADKPPFITLHSLNMRWNDEGEPWIAFPSTKGKDGKYYRYIYATFLDETIETIEKILTE